MNDTKKYMNQWRDNHKDYFRKWRTQNKEHLKKYNEEHKEHRKKIKRDYYLKNRDAFLECTRKWRKENPEKYKQYSENRRPRRHELHLRNKFGITVDDYNKMMESQEHKCAICRRHATEFKRALHVDHIHNDTKQIRGLLCVNCNKMLGHCLDNIETLKMGIVYLQKYSG